MKIINGKILILFLIFTLNLFAEVTAKVDKKNVVEGDSVTFSITADGDKVIFPKIDKIDNFKIESIANSQNISIINGNYQKRVTRSWTFTPLKSLTIPSFIVKVDNKEFHTTPIKVNVVKDSKFNKEFKLEINASKNTIVGYPTLIDIKFFQKTNAKVASVQVLLPKGEFNLKPIGQEKDYYDGVYKVAEVKYLLIPKKEGTIHFNLALRLGFLKTEIDELFVRQVMKYKTIAKNIDINVSKVYDGLVGDYNLSIKVDKTKVDANKPVNGKIVLEGEGDLTNLDDIKIKIPEVTIYENKPKITQIIKNNKIYSKYEKSFVILADKNYTIPPLQFSFYDINEKKVKTIKTNPISVEVVQTENSQFIAPHQTAPSKETQLKTKIVTKYKNNYFIIGLAFVLGVIVGYFLKILKIKSELNFRLPKNLYNQLLIYADNPKIKLILEKLYNKERLTAEEKKFIKEFFETQKRTKNRK